MSAVCTRVQPNAMQRPLDLVE